MKIGAWIPSYSWERMDYATAEGIREFARRAEAIGLDSIWVVDHLLRAPGLYGVSWLDPLCVLNHVAACTSRIRLGTGILVVPIRHPVLLAKEIATLDYLSGGRYIFGIGPGWYDREFEVMGTTIKERGARTDEVLAAVRRLLTEPNVTFEGRFFRFKDVTIDPLPPRMPQIWVSGGSRIPTDKSPDKAFIAPTVLRRILQADCFLIRNSGRHDWVKRDMQTAREFVAQQGRDPSTLMLGHVQFLHVADTRDREEALRLQRPHFERIMGTHRPWPHLQECYLTGTVEDMCGRIEDLRSAGLQYLILGAVSTEVAQLDLIARHILPRFAEA